MARKSKPKPDRDGYLRTGIYRKYVGKSKPEHRLTPEKAEALAMARQSPVTDDIQRIRTGLAAVIRPYVDGPLTEDKMRGVSVRYIDFGSDCGAYVEKPELHQQEQWVIDQFQDAVEALTELRLIQSHLEPDGRIEDVFRGAYRLGRLCERAGVRPCEHAAKIGLAKSRKSAQNAQRTNEKRAARRPDYSAAVKEQMERGVKYDPACQAVATKLDVTKETVRNNTPELRPRKPKQE